MTSLFYFIMMPGIFFFLVIQHALTQSTADISLYYLEPGDSMEISKPGLRIFCHNSKSKYLIHVWRTLTISLNTDLETYDLYDGKTPSEVMEKHDVNKRTWRFNWFGMKKSKQLEINPFEDVCIGIYISPYYNHHHYKIAMNSTRVDSWKVLLTIAGIIVFWSGKKLSRNKLFYYITGVTLGVSFSILILIWFVSKLFGRGKTMYLLAGTGWALSTWLLNIVWEHAQVILIQYREYVLWYMIITSLISFIICYRIGPVTNSKTKNIIQWFLQGSGLAMVYFSSHFSEASFSLAVLLFILYNFPIVILRKGKKYWNTMFPKHPKLLTDDEYRIQGIKETQKALGSLKEYCLSPDSNPWKTVLKLEDPRRFARFMEGDSHISMDETFEHDAELTKLIEECEFTDDENDDY